MELRDRWLAAVSKNQPRIALADGNDPRSHQAAQQLVSWGLAHPVLVFDDPYVALPADIEAIRAEDALDSAAKMLADGEVEAVVAGATRTTRDVLRAGLWKVGLAEGANTISSSFLFHLSDGRHVTYGDCGVIPEPTTEQLADIAVATARTHQQLTGEEPRIAMLSFSTKGSAEHASLDPVREATAMVQASHPELLIDGELQFDAAFIPEVGSSKAPESEVAGHANVFIFPNLSAGNIAYKITERLGGAMALGPLLQGLSKPMHDLSRGCSANDIANVALIAAYQAS